jgi:hypothetical protein
MLPPSLNTVEQEGFVQTALPSALNSILPPQLQDLREYTESEGLPKTILNATAGSAFCRARLNSDAVIGPWVVL